MTYEQFWLGDPWIAKYCRDAYVERRKEENRRDWLLGAYVYNAVAVALGNGFRKKGAKRLNYLEQPFRIFPLTKEEREAEREKEQRQLEANLRRMIVEQRAKKAAKEKKQNAKTRDPRT